MAGWKHVLTRPWGPLLIGAVLALSYACGSTPAASHTPTPGAAASVQASPSAASSPGAGCATAGAASASWPAPASRPAQGSPIVSAAADGDTFTLTFDRGTPAFEVRTQPDAHFTRDASGQPVDLAGTAGLTITLRGFRGDMPNYSGPKSLTSNGPVLVQAAELGDFEGVVTWALGLARPGCSAVTAGSSSLSFHMVPTTG